MANNREISKIRLNNEVFNIKDEFARVAIGDGGNIDTKLAAKVGWADYRTVTEGSGNNAVTKHYIYFYKDLDTAPDSSVVPNSTQYLCRIDAADFVKDGMVSSVGILNGNLVITWNSDSEHNPTQIPLTDIFNPSNYYNKTDSDAKFVTSVGYDTTNGNVTYTVNGAAQTAFTPETSPTSGSKKLITSGGVFTELNKKANKDELTISDVSGSPDKKKVLLKSGTDVTVLVAHLSITHLLPKYSNSSSDWDTVPTSGSTKPITSGGLYTALNNLTTSFNDALDDVLEDVTYTSATRLISKKKVGDANSTGVVILPTAQYLNTDDDPETLEIILASTPS